jgi:hypothetical protein
MDFVWIFTLLHFFSHSSHLRGFCVAGICRGFKFLLFTFYFDFFDFLIDIFEGVGRFEGHDDDTIRYTCDGPQHSTETKRRNELNVRATGLAGVFVFCSSLPFPFAFCSKAIYIWETPFYLHLHFCFRGLEGFRLQSGVREVFLSRQNLNWIEFRR